MKTLYQQLKELNKGEMNVKIGSKQGISFFYCGSVKKSFTSIEKELEEHTKKSVAKKKRIAENRLKNIDKIYEESIKKAFAERNIKDKEKYIQIRMLAKEKEKRNLPKLIKGYEYDLSTKLYDRPVQEVVNGVSPDEKPCKIIYIKGHEQGDFWTIKEYEKAHKKEK